MKKLSEICVVSWDLDGTLYDMKSMRRVLNGQVVSRCLYHPWSGTKDMIELLGLQKKMTAARGDVVEVEAYLRSEKGERFLELQAEWISAAISVCGPRKETHSVMQAVQNRGLKQVVFSDYPVGRKLEVLGVLPWVDHIVAAADTYQVKPDIRSFQRMCDEMQVQPNQVLHVGDRMDTDGGAEAAGIHTLILGRDIENLSQVAERLSRV